MVINISTPWTKVFFTKYVQGGGKTPRRWHNQTKKKFEKQSICLLNKNYVYLASESPRGVNFHFHDSNLSGLQTPRNRN